MAAPRVLADRRCAWLKCQRLFRPRCATRVCCSRRCSALARHARQPDRLARATAVATLRRARARVEAAVRQTYGELSVREIELFNLGRRIGYDRGYATANGRRRRSEAA